MMFGVQSWDNSDVDVDMGHLKVVLIQQAQVQLLSPEADLL